MWLVQLTQGQTPSIRIDLGRETHVGCIKLWNYNKSEEDSYRGVKRVEIVADGRPLQRAALRKAPGTLGIGNDGILTVCIGHTYYDFGQTIRFTGGKEELMAPPLPPIPSTKTCRVLKQDYEVPYHPIGE